VSTQPKRYAIVGVGGRAEMFTKPLCKEFKEGNQLVALCDINPARLKLYQDQIADDYDYGQVPTYLAADFDRMIDETKPDCVIVTTVDAYHDEYIIRAMERGCDAITEKPMTTDDKKCRAILQTIKKTGKNLRVTFNYRWGPGPTRVKQLIKEGVIGEILHVDMEYLLNTSHGADYFRRWHREKDKSGGLMVHKSTHHFDLVNWLIDAAPETVFGFGKLGFYGRANAERRGESVNYDRYTGSDYGDDPFALDLSKNDRLTKLYLDPEKHDNYQRDRNVFGDNITAEDSMSVLVKYRTGVHLNYSLNAYLPREGFHIAFNGSKGRLEYTESHGSHIIGADGDADAENAKWQPKIVVHPMFGQSYEVEIPTATGGHGGGDVRLQEQIFGMNPPAEEWDRNAGEQQGAASILIGIAANHCFETGQPQQIAELCPELPTAAKLSDLK